MLRHRSFGLQAEVILLRAFGSRIWRPRNHHYDSALEGIAQHPLKVLSSGVEGADAVAKGVDDLLF